MNIYRKPEHVKPSLILLNIKQAGIRTEHVSFESTLLIPCKERIQDIIVDHVSPFASGKATVVEFREYENGENGRSTSIRFYGLHPIEVKALIEQEFPKETYHCPHCDSSDLEAKMWVKYNSPGITSGLDQEHDHTVYCISCSEEFHNDETIIR